VAVKARGEPGDRMESTVRYLVIEVDAALEMADRN
jgi:hypothetical protein